VVFSTTILYLFLIHVINNQPIQSAEMEKDDMSSSEFYLAPETEYNWSDWNRDNDEDMWNLYWKIVCTVKENDLSFLDKLEYFDFVAICRKYTSKPEPPVEMESYNDVNIDTIDCMKATCSSGDEDDADNHMAEY
jgi:hypothetical protein